MTDGRSLRAGEAFAVAITIPEAGCPCGTPWNRLVLDDFHRLRCASCGKVGPLAGSPHMAAIAWAGMIAREKRGAKVAKECVIPGRFLVAAARVANESTGDRTRRISIRGGRVEATDTRTLLRMTGPQIDPELRALLPVPLPLPLDAEKRDFRVTPMQSGVDLDTSCDGGTFKIHCGPEEDNYVDAERAYKESTQDQPVAAVAFTAALLSRLLEDMRVAANGGNDMVVQMEIRSPSGAVRLICTNPAGDLTEYRVEALIMPCRPWPAKEG